MICDIPGPLAVGDSFTVSNEFDISQLIGGDTELTFDAIEVYLDSDMSAELDSANNRGSEIKQDVIQNIRNTLISVISKIFYLT